MEFFDISDEYLIYGTLASSFKRKNMSFLQWLIQTKFDLIANGTTIEECREMCSNKGFYWRLPGRNLF